MINSITRKFLASITVCLLLASMFTGVALAKPAMQEFKTLIAYNTAATVMSRASDPIQAFKSLDKNTQDIVRSQLQLYFKQMEAIVNNGGDEYQLQEYIKTIPEAMAYIIQVDFTYTRHESSEGFYHDAECVLTNQHEEEIDNGYRGIKPPDATCPDSYPCNMYRWYEQTCYGSVGGWRHWTMYASISAQHNANQIDWTVGNVSSTVTTANGWTMKKGTYTREVGNTLVYLPNYCLLYGVSNITTCQFSNGILSMGEAGKIAITISMDASGECYITWVDAIIQTNGTGLPLTQAILSAIGLAISLASGNILGIIISYTALVGSITTLN